ncbi:MAG: 3-phosphoshikimate 1-carboxyvinyltransferase [Acidimicrobiia bacterium]|nr:3-phosphoshikimate 1-carboxyvinyltransferase [Acidimicrobiia bacterium]
MSARPVAVANGPIRARIRPPGSKSITIRSLVVAGLAEGRSHLYGALRSDDTNSAVDLLRGFGIETHTEAEPWIVVGTGGALRAPDSPINVGLSGLTARIALVLAAHADGVTRIEAQGRLRARPIGALVESLEAQGAAISTSDGFLPVTVEGVGGLWGGEMLVNSSLTSQFATSLMMVAPLMEEGANIVTEGLESSHGYVELTANVMEQFGAKVSPTITGFEIAKQGYRPTDVVIEPDASSAAYPLLAAAITGGTVTIEGLSSRSRQPDIAVVDTFVTMGCQLTESEDGLLLDGPRTGLLPVEANLSHAPDGALAVAVACIFASGTSRLSGLGSLRHKESDRLTAIGHELRKLGADVSAEADSLTITPRERRGVLIDPHGDHRLAMALGVAGLCIPGLAVTDYEVVSKTWPGFWEMLERLSGEPGPGRVLGSPVVKGTIVTIDGPAGSGKSTVSRVVAERAGLPHLDTGAFYRAATLVALRTGTDLHDEEKVAGVVEEAIFGQENGVMYLNGEDVSAEIRDDPVTSAVSRVSAYPTVRRTLVRHQRDWIEARGGSGVVEGRDIGSAVFPDASVKVYLDASQAERARRRAAQSGEDPNDVLADIARRDGYDSSRETSPLTVPEDAIIIDTTDMTFEEVVEAVLGLIPTDS